MRPVLVLRPQPGADATARRAAERGMRAIVTPLFQIVPKPWTLAAEPFDAVLVTSANAARQLDARLDQSTLVYAVGSATAAALAKAGFANHIVGDQGVEQLIAMAEAAGLKRLVHLAGEDRTSFAAGRLSIERRIVYASEPIDPGASFGKALAEDAVALLHSARAAARFRELAGTGRRIAAISPAVLAAACEGWAATAVASTPADEALLAAALPLCH